MDLTKPAKMIEDKLDDWAGRKFVWHRWFAILPIFTEKNELLWLEWVEKKLELDPNYFCPRIKYKYRKLNHANSLEK